MFFLGIVNLIVMMYLIFRIGNFHVNPHESALTESSSIALFLSAQANQFALLQVLLSVLAIGLAVAAFWGYIEIMSRSEQKAEETVNEVVPRLFKEMLEKFGKEELQRMLLEINMTNPIQENLGNVLSEGLESLIKDPLDMEFINEY